MNSSMIVLLWAILNLCLKRFSDYLNKCMVSWHHSLTNSSLMPLTNRVDMIQQLQFWCCEKTLWSEATSERIVIWVFGSMRRTAGKAQQQVMGAESWDILSSTSCIKEKMRSRGEAITSSSPYHTSSDKSSPPKSSTTSEIASSAEDQVFKYLSLR